MIVSAGPFAPEVAVLVDLISVLGADVLVLIFALYYQSAVDWVLPMIRMCHRSLVRGGVLIPDHDWFHSPAEFARYVGHNLCVVGTWRGPAVAALLLIGAMMAMSLINGFQAVDRA